MKLKIAFIIGLILIALIPLVFGQAISWAGVLRLVRNTFPAVKQMTTQQLASWYAQPNKRFVILDAREPAEYEISHLKNAVRIDPNATNFPSLQNISNDTPIVVYCSVGYRSSQLAERIQRSGRANIYNLEGSIFKWANEGKPVYHGTTQVQKVHPYDSKWGLLLDKKYRQ